MRSFILFHDRSGAWCAAPAPGFRNVVRDPTGGRNADRSGTSPSRPPWICPAGAAGRLASAPPPGGIRRGIRAGKRYVHESRCALSSVTIRYRAAAAVTQAGLESRGV